VRELPPPAGTSQTYGQSIDASGVVVGYSHEAGADVPTIWRPTPGGYIAGRLALPAGQTMGAANAISSDGGAIAGYTQPDDGSTATATVWTSSGGGYSPVPLPVPVGSALTAAYAVNATGQAAGFTTNTSDQSTGITWTPAGGGTFATTLLPFPGRTDSVATAVNGAGDVAGYTTGTGGLLGAVWVRSGNTYTPKTVISAESALITAMNDAGTGAGVYDEDQPLVMVLFEGDYYALDLNMPFGSSDGATNGVNNFDALVGYAKDADTATPGQEAALWMPGETQWEYVNLDVWLDQVNPTLGARWTLSDAMSISDAWLVTGNGLFDPDGTGPLDEVERAFVLDVSAMVPEPAGAAIALIAALPLLARRRR
jgi:hypothetical protein